ncbi:MAG TPA: peptidase [Gemmatimonadota bacterium]|nr:peptidase [Gemmatimonadota bacterium]
MPLPIWRALGRSLALASILLALAAPLAAQTAPSGSAGLTYHVDLRDRADDRFHVRLTVDGFPAGSDVLQFAATAPGTYQVMDIGRFVDGLRATGVDGSEIPVEQVSTNQWRFASPAEVREISYTVAETWDTVVEEHPIYPMAGTSIEADHVLFNAHAVLGFPARMQDAPIRLELAVPEGWTVATALQEDPAGVYQAEDFDFLVDSPILAGSSLTVAATEVGGAPVEIYTYAKAGEIRSDMLLESMEDMLNASADFLGGLPVDRYVFLYHFEDPPRQGVPYGAWEHSYSSEYVFPEAPWSEGYAQAVADVAAHEFLHIVTPLNIHSEIIEHFDFEKPVPSRHLWLYEGVTEWGSHMVQLRAGLKPLDTYLTELVQKIAADQTQFDPTYPLEKLALTSYGDEGQAQYGNIYMRGALVAGLLDIRLLEVSNGEMDLQDVLLELMERYGKSRPFDDATFHQTLVELTFPEIGDFIERYVVAAEPLPIAEYYGKLGIDYDPAGPSFSVRENPTEEQSRLRAAWMGNRPKT